MPKTPTATAPSISRFGMKVLTWLWLLLAACVLAPAAGAQQDSAEGAISTPPSDAAGAEQFSPEERAALHAIIREYLLENPEVILEAVQRLEERQRAEQEQRRRQALTAQRDRIEDGSNAPVMGNPDGDVTLVEFFDYNCPYCKRMTDALRTLIDEDSGLRVVMREYPILSEGSRFAARAALAAKKQGKYEAFHFALMDAKGRVGEQETIDIASRLGLDIERLRADMESPEIQAHIDETYALAQALGVRGTPAFIVGDELVPGATSLEQLRAMVSESRKES